MYEDIFFMGIVIAFFLGLIPATIAKKKGRSFLLWWLYGWALFIVALIHSIVMEDRNAKVSPQWKGRTVSIADELEKYNALLEKGAITPREYEIKKRQLLDLDL